MSFDKESTDYVSMWICNDGYHYFQAQRMAKYEDLKALEVYLRATLRTAPEDSAAWHTSNGLSNNDLDRVDWKEIASDLTAE